MDSEPRPYTLYPLEVTAETEPGYDAASYARTFEKEMSDRLAPAGFERHEPAPGTPDLDIVVRGRVTTVEPGDAMNRLLVGFGAGAAVFEADLRVERGGSVLSRFQARGVRRFSWYGGGDSNRMLDNSAELAGRQAARMIIEILSRP